jgi:uncharacterized phage-associated protein
MLEKGRVMFREDKATQMAAHILEMSGGKIDYILLLKLLYYADKEMLVRRGRPITYDQWCSMRFGPVLSKTYDLIKAAREPSDDSYWGRHIRTESYCAVLVESPGSDTLSPAEESIIEAVFKEHGSKEVWQVIQETHNLPEWTDPGESSIPISYDDVLKVGGFPSGVIAEIREHIAEQDDLARMAG